MFKLLVVEDDRELNKTVCSYLNQNGYEAVGCLSANEMCIRDRDKVIADLIVECHKKAHRTYGYRRVKIW